MKEYISKFESLLDNDEIEQITDEEDKQMVLFRTRIKN